MSRETPNRRAFLRRTAVLTGCLLAGCGNDGEDETPPTPTPEPTERTDGPVPTPTDTATVELTPTSTRSPTETRTSLEVSGIEFDRSVDAVDDLGMDPTGETPIDDALDAAHETGTLVTFPEGKYLVSREHVWKRDVSRFGMFGRGDTHTDVQFVLPKGEAFRMVTSDSGTEHLFRGFSIQQTDDDRTSASMWISHDNGTVVDNVEWLGRTPTDDVANGQLLAIETTAVSGVNVVRRVFIREGAVTPGYPNGVMGVRLPRDHVGEVRLEHCHVEQLSSSSFRSTSPTGVLTVRGGLFKNNDNTNMRLGAGSHPTKTSSIDGAVVVVDVENLNEHAQPEDEIHSPVGLQIDASGNGYAGTIVENCHFFYRSSPEVRGVVSVPSFGSHGGFTLRNCHIHNESSAQTIGVETFDTETTSRPWGVTLENVSIRADVDAQPHGAIVYIGEHRNDSVVRNSCVYCPNAGVDGFRFADNRGCVVEDSNVNVAGTPIETKDATVTRRELGFNGKC